MAWGRSSSGGGCASWLALVVSLVALFLSWSAYTRTGGTVGQLADGARHLPSIRVGDGEGGDWRRALDQARERLQEHRSEVEDDRNLEQVRQDVEKIRENLERAFNNAGEAKEKWRDLDDNLERLEAQLKEGGSKALATLDETLEKMKK